MNLSLLDCFTDLTRAILDFSKGLEHLNYDSTKSLLPLRRGVSKLNQTRAYRPIHATPEYVESWNQYLLRRESELEPRAIKYLCWETDIATDIRFHNYLDNRQIALRPQSLQGLVRACHSRWSPKFLASPVLDRVRRRVCDYHGPNRLIHRWKNSINLILGPGADQLFSEELLGGRRNLAETCEQWGIQDDTAFIVAVAKLTAASCRERVSHDGAWGPYLIEKLLKWKGWDISEFKDQVAQTILHEQVNRDDKVRKSLIDFILSNPRQLLGDPRLPANATKWAGVKEKARTRVIQWLSGLDVVFFFEHVMRRGQDHHGRKNFWLHYVKGLKQSRPLLNLEDLQRLRPQLSRLPYDSTHGFVADQHSAFLLDFGPVLVIEFNKMGACYVYDRSVVNRVVPEFWTATAFSYSRIKQKRLVSHWIVHDVGGNWKWKLQNILARYGIRPSS